MHEHKYTHSLASHFLCVSCTCVSARIPGCTLALSRLALHTSYVFIVSFIFLNVSCSTLSWLKSPPVSDTSLSALEFPTSVIVLPHLDCVHLSLVTFPLLYFLFVPLCQTLPLPGFWFLVVPCFFFPTSLSAFSLLDWSLIIKVITCVPPPFSTGKDSSCNPDFLLLSRAFEFYFLLSPQPLPS